MTNEEAIEQYKKMHKYPESFRGYSLGPHVKRIKELVDETQSKTLLDYGCGKAWQWTKKGAIETIGIRPTLYDPAVKEYSRPPEGQYDGVICTDVLEHIPEPMPFVIHVSSFARNFVFFSISCLDRGKTLPNGKPLHISVHPPQWWREWVKCTVRVRCELAFDVED